VYEEKRGPDEHGPEVTSLAHAPEPHLEANTADMMLSLEASGQSAIETRNGRPPSVRLQRY
jgi:hypothetical protein